MTRRAVVLFNLGGPDGPKAVRPFLFNLFRDPAIIGAPTLIRYPLAAFISTTREKTAQANYAVMGGSSPLRPETEAQGRALETELVTRRPDEATEVFIAMRYWKPFAKATARAVAEFEPDEIVLLPLYPQYSTTTTGSSLANWARAYRGPGVTRTICCYPTAQGLAQAHAAAIRKAWDDGGRPAKVRLLFSAHGLPQRVIDAGDPYRVQIEATSRAIAALLPELPDWTISYQSRVGPLKWLQPSTEDAIRRAQADGLGVVISPVAFVSEHVETLVELDHEYADLARDIGCAPYLRARTPSVSPLFIHALADAVLAAPSTIAPACGWACPAEWTKCPRSPSPAAQTAGLEPSP